MPAHSGIEGNKAAMAAKAGHEGATIVSFSFIASHMHIMFRKIGSILTKRFWADLGYHYRQLHWLDPDLTFHPSPKVLCQLEAVLYHLHFGVA